MANSFIERVEESPEPETPEAEASETAEAEEGSEEDVLLQSESEESETESEAEVEETEAEPPKGVGKLLKQVGKLTARAKSAEERVEAMGAEIANLKAQPNEQKAEPQGSPVLEEVANFDDLEKVRQEAIAAKKWAVQHLGKEYVEEGEKEYTGDEVREIFAAADEYLTEKIPQRAGFLKAKAESDARSREVFDFWDNPEDEANLLYQQVLADPRYASLNALPNRDFVMGLIVEGFRSVNDKAESKGKPAKRKPAKTPPATLEESVAPPPQNKDDRQKKRVKDAIAAGNISANQFADLLT